MNNRVLELLKNPKNIQSEDLNLLKEEINSFPYIQNIRALHLYGVHLYDQENYQKELSTTAAYTTDKKILYQLINGKIQQKTKPEIVENKNTTEVENRSRYFPKSKSFPIKREELSGKSQIKESVPSQLPGALPEIKHIYVNGERNRILFEGEENFLDENNHETIDLESTLESGTIVTQKQNIIPSEEPVQEIESLQGNTDLDEVVKPDESEDISAEDIELAISSESGASENINQVNDIQEEEPSKEVGNDFKDNESTEFTPEEIINEDQITSPIEKEEVSDNSELSFHGTDSFMPDVKIESGTRGELPVSEISQPSFNKHEDEMRRLIEEVEKKMKASKVIADQKKEDEPEMVSHDINFAETQSFHPVIKEEEKEKKEVVQETTDVKSSEDSEIKTEVLNETASTDFNADIKSDWKPMSFESNVPDSLLNKPIEPSKPKEEIIKEELPIEKNVTPIEVVSEPIEDVEEESKEAQEEISDTENAVENNKEEVPVMNVSFFSSDISSWTHNEEEKEESPEEDIVEKEEISSDPVDSNVPGFINTWQSWLKIDRTEKEPEKDKAEVKNKVIESFIENNPKISQLKDESNFVVKEKNDDISHLMTETLAKLYFEQKLYTKAIKAFEILATKHPEKKSYFEDKVQEVKDVRGKN
ncbi:hypothetical protein [Chryseobacterium paridis]|uniref:Tetratricopeptide repeat protein n=1 Tax=Chryseobacterium paridis TaxID=2800328 RepID=A0ABS1FR78_9FLAO|nr:hypothetical protein [Chryseobacterium paridis]MBK1894938.1 hypothetical protein [Chryseobacterium paridis]